MRAPLWEQSRSARLR